MRYTRVSQAVAEVSQPRTGWGVRERQEFSKKAPRVRESANKMAAAGLGKAGE